MSRSHDKLFLRLCQWWSGHWEMPHCLDLIASSLPMCVKVISNSFAYPTKAYPSWLNTIRAMRSGAYLFTAQAVWSCGAAISKHNTLMRLTAFRTSGNLSFVSQVQINKPSHGLNVYLFLLSLQYNIGREQHYFLDACSTAPTDMGSGSMHGKPKILEHYSLCHSAWETFTFIHNFVQFIRCIPKWHNAAFVVCFTLGNFKLKWTIKTHIRWHKPFDWVSLSNLMKHNYACKCVTNELLYWSQRDNMRWLPPISSETFRDNPLGWSQPSLNQVNIHICTREDSVVSVV